MGDTCYSWSEDTPVFNPDGREIIARDNEISILRKEDISMAYYGCHTDITIPYEELGSIRVIDEDGEGTSIIENGRFVLPGTEELNRPFEKITIAYLFYEVGKLFCTKRVCPPNILFRNFIDTILES